MILVTSKFFLKFKPNYLKIFGLFKKNYANQNVLLSDKYVVVVLLVVEVVLFNVDEVLELAETLLVLFDAVLKFDAEVFVVTNSVLLVVDS
jgi:hypothetical protein